MKNSLTEERACTLLEVLTGQRREAIMALALLTGMRRDELVHLKWQDVDLEKREVRVHTSKTKHGYRIVHISDHVAEMIMRHRLHQLQTQSEAGSAWYDLGLVFPDRMGRFLRPDQLLEEWYELLQQAGLPPLHFHDIRIAREQALRTRLHMGEEERGHAQVGYLDLDKDTYPF